MPESRLAPYAAAPAHSRGRHFPESPPRGRSDYQRDRDRIIHSTAFRRLEYKTQVFVNHEGDLFRTRLTHSLEVAQLGRSIARNLGLEEDLTEAIALAHDLGHTPFGHAGQDALNACMKPYGGFEHNLQSLRVVDLLEQRYAAFDGLNLTFETREGILKHCSLRDARELGEVGERFLKKRRPSLEAQIANVADEIAYNNHDVDDGLRSGLLNLDELREVSIFKRHEGAVLQAFPGLSGRRLVHETVRRMIDTLVTDLIEASSENIRREKPESLEEVRSAPALIGFSESVRAEQLELKRFLNEKLYRHYRVARMSSKARRIVTELFGAFLAEPTLLPPEFQSRASDDKPRAIADYIAGMTDRYAMLEHRRLFAIEAS
ncbi:MAG TPA: deoxyguanosinetriphosphate triphosphohydrolase [Burkholderiales bacterium]|nr:deoxyguanosinetriphosphate triphosphohydrolase [Burkholderiales bacterium]